jgi:hypothetical protein
MTWSITQSNDHENGSTNIATVAVTFAAPVTPGNMVVVFIGKGNSAQDLSTVTDDKGNNYNLTGFATSGTYAWFGAWLNNITNSPSTVTGTFATNHAFSSILAIEVAPPASAVVTFDQSANNNQLNPGTGTDAVTTGSVTTTAADLMIAGCVSEVGNGINAGTGYTPIQLNISSNSFTTEYLVQSVAASQAATWTTPVSSDSYMSILMAFTGTVPIPPPLILGLAECEW